MDAKEFLKSEEGKAVIAAAVEEATAGLKAKRDELIGEVKKLKTERESFEERIGQLEELETDKNKKAGDWEKERTKLEEKHTKQLKEVQDKLDASTGHINKLVIDNGLTEALTKVNIAPVHMAAVSALLKSSNKIDLDSSSGSPVAKVGDKGLADFVKTWADSDVGKHYVAAPTSSGGGRNNTTQTTTSTTGTSQPGQTPIQRLTQLRSGQ